MVRAGGKTGDGGGTLACSWEVGCHGFTLKHFLKMLLLQLVHTVKN